MRLSTKARGYDSSVCVSPIWLNASHQITQKIVRARTHKYGMSYQCETRANGVCILDVSVCLGRNDKRTEDRTIRGRWWECPWVHKRTRCHILTGNFSSIPLMTDFRLVMGIVVRNGCLFGMKKNEQCRQQRKLNYAWMRCVEPVCPSARPPSERGNVTVTVWQQESAIVNTYSLDLDWQ